MTTKDRERKKERSKLKLFYGQHTVTLTFTCTPDKHAKLQHVPRKCVLDEATKIRFTTSPDDQEVEPCSVVW